MEHALVGEDGVWEVSVLFCGVWEEGDWSDDANKAVDPSPPEEVPPDEATRLPLAAVAIL